MKLRIATRLVAALLGLLLFAAAGIYAVLSASLPRRAGEAVAAGLEQPVRIELDARGIPRIHAESTEDLWRAQGFLHAQDRFFQMDLMRRSQAGELAAFVGARALALDREQRVFDFRARAAALADRLTARDRARLKDYTEGVNAGLADLGARPPEYWLLRQTPAPWTVEDSLLVVFAFYTMLSNNEAYERSQAVMRATLPPGLYDFLTPSTSRFDRPVLAWDDDATGGYRPVEIPPAAVYDLRGVEESGTGAPRIDPPLNGAASNQWVVDRSRSSRGEAMLANDPHLRLRLPSVFYRTELEWPGGTARGVGIPGVPGILLGATDAIAWGATVSNADQADWVVVETDPADPGRYLVPGGSEPFERKRHWIEVAGAEPEAHEVLLTRFGPVVERDWLGRPLALHATWLEPGGVNLDILDLIFARTASEALEVLAAWRGPSQNWVVADAAGDIAWIANGPLPRRVGYDGSSPQSWADGTRRWDGEHEPPSSRGSPKGALFTANSRTLPWPASNALGRMWMRPTRAHRIGALLDARPSFDERDFLDMQLDTRAAGYERMRALVLEVVAEDDPDERLRAVRKAVVAWNGRADPGEPAFDVLHRYYLALLDRVLGPLLLPAAAADPRFVYRWPLADEPLRRLLDERPPHFLLADYKSWPEFLRAVLRDSLRDDAPKLVWGEVNRLRVAHPLGGLPVIGRWLRLPDAALPGSMVSLRVAAPDYGAVIRMAVSPATPSEGFLQMAGGQSGHFLSPHFADLTEDWLDGTPTPFLAGPTVDSFRLVP